MNWSIVSQRQVFYGESLIETLDEIRAYLKKNGEETPDWYPLIEIVGHWFMDADGKAEWGVSIG